MNLIERAAKRMEELERAGEVPWSADRVQQRLAETALPPIGSEPLAPPQPAAPAVPAAPVAEQAAPRPAAAPAPLPDPWGTPAPVVASHAPAVAPLGDGLYGAPSAPASATPFVPPAGHIDPLSGRATWHPTEDATPKGHVNIDLALLDAEGYVVPSNPRSAAARQYRVIKQQLLHSLKPEGAMGYSSVPSTRASQIVVTSSLAGEGKTYTAINLAIAMAMEIDHAVLLVDADVVRPQLLKRLGITGEHRGLMDLLSNEALPLSEVVLSTNVPKLSLLPPGTASEVSAEWISSGAMDRVLDRLGEAFPRHIILFDTPPVLVTTESAALASKVSQVLMVVESSRTPQRALREAYAALQQCRNVRSVLNKHHEFTRERYGEYYA